MRRSQVRRSQGEEVTSEEVTNDMSQFQPKANLLLSYEQNKR